MRTRLLPAALLLATAAALAAEASAPTLVLPGGKESPVTPQALLAAGAVDVRVEEGNGVTVYRGRPLLEVLEKAGLDTEGMPNQRALASAIVVATGRDGYAAVFSVGELVMHRSDPKVYLVAATAGGPLPEKQGPVRLIVVGQRARSAYALAKLEVRSASNSAKAP
jgi:hypothetical protein